MLASTTSPNVLAVGHPPTVRVRVGLPVDVKHRSVDADTKRIMQAKKAVRKALEIQQHLQAQDAILQKLIENYQKDAKA